MSEVAILIPVLNRPHRIAPLLESIANATNVAHRILFAASDEPTVDEISRLGAVCLIDEGGDEGSYAKRINRLFRATTEPYVFLAADDLAFRSGWFEAAMRTMSDVDGVVAVNDLHNPAGVHFLVSRNYIDSLGGCIGEPGVVLHEGYRHAYCDDEFRATAQSRNRWAVAHDSVVEHLHHGAGKSQTDETYALGAASMSQGYHLFLSRAHLWR